MTLPDLIARLEQAEGGSRELDAALHVHLNGWKLASVGPDYDGQNESEVWTENGELVPNFAYPPRGKVGPFFHVPDWSGRNDYTRSTDAALGLVQQHKPAWAGLVHLSVAGSGQAVIEARDPCDPRTVQAFGHTPALALVLALCLALQSQGTPHEG